MKLPQRFVTLASLRDSDFALIALPQEFRQSQSLGRALTLLRSVGERFCECVETLQGVLNVPVCRRRFAER